MELAQGSLNEHLLQSLVWVSHSLKDQYKHYRINPEHALSILNHALNWKPQAKTTLWHSNFDAEIADLIATALASTVLPSLQPSTIGDKQIRTFINRVSDGSFPALLTALPELVRLDKSSAEEATKAIQKGLISQDSDIVRAALAAVFRFYRFKKAATHLQDP